MNKFLLISFGTILIFSSINLFAQEEVEAAIATEAQARPREQIGMYLFWFTQADPLKLLNEPNSKKSAMNRISPCFEIEWGYGTPWFFNNNLRFSFKFWTFGRYNWSDNVNGLDNDNNPLQFMFFLNICLTRYLKLEVDTRGRMQVFTSYTWQLPQASIKVELSTRFWLTGNGYKDETIDGIKVATFRRSMWDYTTLDIHQFWNPTTISPRINRFTLYTRLRMRFRGDNIYNTSTNIDTGEVYGEDNPNLANLFYFSVRFRFETWLTNYFAIIPLTEFVINGTQTTSTRQPYGLNVGVMTRFSF